MNHLLYIIGVPGSGKSSLVAELVKGRKRMVQTKPFVHTVYEDGLVQLGREREGRSGTDALSMSAQPNVLAALETGVWPRVLGEGDRLTNRKFFEAAREAGYRVDVVLLDTPMDVAAFRRGARGSEQSESWLKGRETKIEGLRGLATLTLNGNLPVAALARQLASHPVLSCEPTERTRNADD